ncbi:Diadenosine tetraphosphate (Ap4A) hydrolase and other HIT family hydrolases [hydrothermal vent metagenome]|uniref:Diadenosine tetraphosphate (Ap4A) hydrolase and other HIT family hydrolases n=1 Tax=hydrothermal vent metagenome TaxID=652676 RepID=A0A3B0X8S2_9ZZZZ
MPFTLHPQLQADCYEPGTINSSLLLLHKNALVPWFILVPNTHENELFKLEPAHQQLIQEQTSQIARFVITCLKAEKLNIATIGNIVPQLHIHIIGRHSDDFCWPAPVWGQSEFAHYTPQKLQRIKADLIRENIIDTAHS